MKISLLFYFILPLINKSTTESIENHTTKTVATAISIWSAFPGKVLARHALEPIKLGGSTYRTCAKDIPNWIETGLY